MVLFSKKTWGRDITFFKKDGKKEVGKKDSECDTAYTKNNSLVCINYLLKISTKFTLNVTDSKAYLELLTFFFKFRLFF